MTVSKTLLIEQTKQFVQQLELLKPKQESLECYLLNNLNIYLRSIENACRPCSIKNATRLFGRFCTEYMDWDTDLFKSCMELTKIGDKLGKQDQL